MGWSLKFCISNKPPDDTEAAVSSKAIDLKNLLTLPSAFHLGSPIVPTARAVPSNNPAYLSAVALHSLKKKIQTVCGTFKAST